MTTETVTAVKPLRNRLYVQRIRQEKSESGLIHFPQAFRAGTHGHSAKAKMNATPDHFPARVLAIGPEVHEVTVGDELLVWTFAEGDGSKLYTGESVGERDKMFIVYPDDIVCVVER